MASIVRQAKSEIRAWAAESPRHRRVMSIRHVHPRCYVVARPAPGCLIVACPWVDGEPHMREWEREYGASVFHTGDFDDTLRAGDWCMVGYVSTPVSGGNVAVPFSAPRKQAVAKGGRSQKRPQRPVARNAGKQKT